MKKDITAGFIRGFIAEDTAFKIATSSSYLFGVSLFASFVALLSMVGGVKYGGVKLGFGGRVYGVLVVMSIFVFLAEYIFSRVNLSLFLSRIRMIGMDVMRKYNVGEVDFSFIQIDRPKDVMHAKSLLLQNLIVMLGVERGATLILTIFCIGYFYELITLEGTLVSMACSFVVVGFTFYLWIIDSILHKSINRGYKHVREFFDSAKNTTL